MIREEINLLTGKLNEAVKGLAESAKTSINGAITGKTEEAKEKAIEATNQFINDKVNTISDKMPDLHGLSSPDMKIDGTGSASKAISFGYSDYLRVFLFLGLCKSDDAILQRTANLIETNINYPSSGGEDAKSNKGWFQEAAERISWFFTKKSSGSGGESNGEWKLTNAYTYVKVDADIEMI